MSDQTARASNRRLDLSFVRDSTWIPYVLLATLFLVIALPLVVNGSVNYYGSSDETNFHYPTIQQFRDQFPNLDLINYSSATTPLYHVLMLIPAALFNSNLLALRVVTVLISVLCLFLMYIFYARSTDVGMSFLLTCLIAVSPYFLGSAIRLSTDNLALLWMMITLLTIREDRSVFATLLAVLTRQTYVWLLGISLVANFTTKRRIRSILLNLIPLSGLLFFAVLWRGLTPPRFADHLSQSLINLDVFTYILSLVGFYGVFFLPHFVDLIRKELISALRCGVLILGSLVFLGLHPMSSESLNGTEGGALWRVAQYFPSLLSTPLLYWVLFPTGIICLYLLLRHQDRLFIATFGCWLAANLVSDRIYQKYYEPFLLFYMSWFLANNHRRADWISVVLLLAVLLGLSIWRL